MYKKNEKDDGLAREGSNSPLYGPKLAPHARDFYNNKHRIKWQHKCNQRTTIINVSSNFY